MGKSSKRDDVLNATLRLIVRHDLENTSMDMIAKEAQVGMGTIYNYFPSKEILVNELYRSLQHESASASMQGFTDTAPLREQFVRMLRNKFHFYLNNPETFQVLQQYSMSPILDAETKAEGWTLWQTPIRIVEQARAQQIVKELSTDKLMLIATSPIISLVREHISGNITLTEDDIEAAITACWDAIKR